MSINGLKPRVVFAHGKESGPWGTKIQALARIARHQGFSVESPDYQGITKPEARVAHLERLAPQGSPLVLVGSSMGGYVSAMACQSLRPAGLFLLAPALYLPGYPGDPEGCPADTVVFHGWSDDLVPVSSSVDFAAPRRATLHVVNDGHRLTERLDFIAERFTAQLERVLAEND